MRFEIAFWDMFKNVPCVWIYLFILYDQTIKFLSFCTLLDVDDFILPLSDFYSATGEEDTLFVQIMWKISQSLSGDNEEQGESLLGEDSGGLFSLSPTQVLSNSKLFTPNLAVWDLL